MDTYMYPKNEYVDVQSIISSLKRHPESQELHFAHSSLGDHGCEALFRWLGENGGTAGDAGPKELHVIDLNDVEMEDAGFQAMCDYLHIFKSAREGSSGSSAPGVNSHWRICLRYNLVEGSPELAQSFVSVVTPSEQFSSVGLTSLILSNNPLSPDFKEALFGSLLSCALNLLELRMDVTRLTPADAEALPAYISDARCQLTKFTASANSMGYAGVKRIVFACRESYTLEQVRMYANGAADPWSGVEAEADDDEVQDPSLQVLTAVDREADSEAMDIVKGSGCEWPSLTRRLRQTLIRNTLLKHQVQQDAIVILRYARIMLPSRLLRAQTSFSPFLPNKCSPAEQSDSHTSSPTRFQSLPAEIQHIIFSFLGPHLSPAQLLNIVEFAIDRGTLPRLFVLPTLPRRTSLPGGTGGVIGIAQGEKILPFLEPPFSTRLPALLQNVEERNRWFRLVGCECFNPLSTKRRSIPNLTPPLQS